MRIWEVHLIVWSNVYKLMVWGQKDFFLAIKLIKSDIYNVTKKYRFQINAVLLNLLLICESWKIKHVPDSTKMWSSATVFNVDNNQKCFLSRYYYDFWRSCDTDIQLWSQKYIRLTDIK